MHGGRDQRLTVAWGQGPPRAAWRNHLRLFPARLKLSQLICWHKDEKLMSRRVTMCWPDELDTAAEEAYRWLYHATQDVQVRWVDPSSRCASDR